MARRQEKEGEERRKGLDATQSTAKQVARVVTEAKRSHRHKAIPILSCASVASVMREGRVRHFCLASSSLSSSIFLLEAEQRGPGRRLTSNARDRSQLDWMAACATPPQAADPTCVPARVPERHKREAKWCLVSMQGSSGGRALRAGRSGQPRQYLLPGATLSGPCKGVCSVLP
ncbi:hypothetical protein GQ53DRAFT_188417 [Thozetella sp. PMI_491]|nr:hypothetical protein GQ53DRAFT_188417 [Thozetella sp. PMI_491]